MDHTQIEKFLEELKSGKYTVLRTQNIIDAIVKSMERNCDTCADQIVCFAYNTLDRENCDEWQPDFMEVQNRYEYLQRLARKAMDKKKEEDISKP